MAFSIYSKVSSIAALVICVSGARADLTSTDDADSTSGKATKATTYSGDAAAFKAACDKLTSSAAEHSGGSEGNENWWEKENCKKVEGGGSSSSSGSSGSSGGLSSGSSGGSSSGGGGGGGGECWHVTACIKGGGLVNPGYDPGSEVFEKQMKAHAEEGLKRIKAACEKGISALSGSSVDAEAMKKAGEQAAGIAKGAASEWGTAIVEYDLTIPLYKRFPDPLAPMAIKNDVSQICEKKKDGKDKCIQACTEKGNKLKKVSQECVDNLEKARGWFEQKIKEAEELAKAFSGVAVHANYETGGTTTALQTDTTTTGGTARNLVPGISKKSTGSSSSGSGFSTSMSTGATSGQSMGQYSPLSEDGTLSDDSASGGVAAAAGVPAARALASGSYSGTGIDENFGAGTGGVGGGSSGSAGSTYLGGDMSGNYFSFTAAEEGVVPTSRDPGKNPRIRKNKEEIISLDKLRRARVRVIERNGKAELVYQEISLWERGAMHTVGLENERGIYLAEQEVKRKEVAASKGIGLARAMAPSKVEPAAYQPAAAPANVMK